MLRSVDGWDSEHFAFGGAESPLAAAASAIALENGPDGATATIPDAHLLFTAQFSRAGADLILQGEDGKTFAVHDYFATDARARLLSPEGAALSPHVVAALAGPLAPGQVAQAGPAQANAQAVGRVAQVEGGATIIRNGIAMQANAGDAILKGDVLQTVTGSLGVTFNDGSTLNITANSRLVVNEFIYDPKGSQNSQLLDLVQGSLTFISGEVAHSGDMKIGTPVATMGIRGTVGGVTTANDGTVRFYVSQSATGAVILDSRGTIIANVVQDGPLIVVRPVGPLQVLAEELQKSPAQLATELAALQHIVSIKSVGDQLIQQFFQQNPTNNPNPQSTDHPHTQIPDVPIDLKPDPLANGNGDDGNAPPVTAIITIPPPPTPGAQPPPDPDPIIVAIPANLPPINFGPLNVTTGEDETLTFTGPKAISVFDADTSILKVTLSATHGTLSLNGVAGLSFGTGNGTNDATMTFSGTQAAINAALDGMTFKPDSEYSGLASVTITTSDSKSTSAETVDISVYASNDAPVLWQGAAPEVSYTENHEATVVDAALTITDVDSANLVGAKVTISGNFHIDQDVLHFTDQNGITGYYINGVLTLNGTASLADYQAALRSVTYANTSDDPSPDIRTISFQINDGSDANNLSNEIIATVAVGPVNDAPAISGTASTGGLLSTGLTAIAAQYLIAGHDLINSLGGSAGFGEYNLPANDDGSTGAIDVTSVFGDDGLNFFGHTYTSLYINNNGNITFGAPNSTFTPQSITAGSLPIIAPFWADVDTRGGPTIPETGNSTGSNLVYYDLDPANRVMTVTWDDVGYFSEHTNAANAFQLQLISTGDGNFDIVMRYESINWTAGDASNGSGGVGGTSARAGYAAGDNNQDHYYELPQSGNQAAMIALESTPGNSGISGVDVFQVQSGSVSAAATISGAIGFTDPDSSDTHTATVQPSGGNYIGAFTLDDPNNNDSHVTEANGTGSVAWHFNLTSGESTNILLNSTPTQSYEVTIADNHNASVMQMVSISFASNAVDTFHFDFDTHLGANTILNFDTCADFINLEGYDTITNHDQILAALSSNGADVNHGDAVINLGHGDSITVAGVTQFGLQQHLDHVLLGTLA